MRNITLTMKSYMKSLPFIPTPFDPATDAPPTGKYFNLPANECAICADSAAFDVTRLTSSGPVATLSSTTASSSTDKHAVSSSEDENPPSYPLNTTYLTSCNHAYCYICLSDAMLRARDDGRSPWECLRCGQPVVWSERAEADVSTGTENTDSMDEYEFSTDHDSESLGESLGSIQTLDYVTSN
jgi:peroxin-2